MIISRVKIIEQYNVSVYRQGKWLQYSMDMQLSVAGVQLAAKQHLQLHIIVVQWANCS